MCHQKQTVRFENGVAMERIFWVKNGELKTVNDWLQKGGRVKSIHPVAETISSYGYSGNGEDMYNTDEHGYNVGDIYAYIVIEFD